ncbi:putative Zn-dependent peptidase [Sedimentibacter acidaminivorans]|jgi:predicted Zn-dependent peptidase|uniref:Zn-dependent peptidase n=1 Tax=Sedimentibacter acidaminivorans TaxID=913099 RepID=A0ABS4GC82_9FIRM|nr:pitrilysin family protein [Sedimentibacter acidaminivorans]MBP1925301.1 putative Zn-dependent peptidase [Sedimentibacter acidaminivorans]
MINKYTLDNGLRIVAEKIDYVKSASIGIWVKVGSNNEDNDTNGLSHFIEHMLFKGTENRKANKIAEDIDNIGGQINAFTSKEYTCFYVKVLDENINDAVDVLSDMFFNSLFQQEEIEKEISVVIEEIKMYEDSPEDVVHDKITEIVFDKSPMAYSILGTEKNLRTFNTKKVIDFMRKNYSPYNTVMAIAGNFDEENFIELIKDKFEHWQNENASLIYMDGEYERKIIGVNKELEQLHMCIGNKTIGRHDPYYYPLLVLNNIFGGTMSSRIFQEVREKKGLVYSIYSFVSNYTNSGIFSIYAGMSYDQVEDALRTIFKEMTSMKNGNITLEEFNRAKQQIKGNYILGLESTSSRMSSIGRRELIYDEVVYPEDIIKSINDVKYEDVLKITNDLFDINKLSITYTGNLNKHKDLDDKINKILGEDYES